MVAQEKFREDLYYRLSVVPIRVPALRERPHDIRLLAEYFLEDFCARNNFKRQDARRCRFSRCWKAIAWPGNARELRNVIERMAILTPGERLTRESIPVEIRVQREPARAPPFRKPANPPSASTSCGRWRNPTGMSRAPRERWGWSAPICISAFGRWG